MPDRDEAWSDELRAKRLIAAITTHLDLDLTGLTVYTEAASGAYLFTPLMAAYAGAHVIALAQDSSYAPAAVVEARTREAAARLGVDARVKVVTSKTEEDISSADIITNSGFVRPIDAEMVEWMRETAVVPLMWETWEFRPDDLDLPACKRKGILVLGTVESRAPVDMRPYAGVLATKLLFQLGLEVHKTKVAVLGGQAGLGGSIVEHLRRSGCVVGWFASSASNDAAPYTGLARHWNEEGATYDAVIVAEHEDDSLLLGTSGYLTFEVLAQANPGVRIGVIAGNIDALQMASSQLRYEPKVLRPFGYMSYQPHELGPRPVLELYGGGLKVGEVMARARLSGKAPREAATFALRHSPAMDLQGRDAWT